MRDEQLLEFDREQAEQQLNPDQLERYNELKKQELEGAIEDKKAEDAENAINGLAALRQDKEKELTVKVHGIEFLADVNEKQLHKLVKFSKYEDKKAEDLDDSTIQNIRSDMLDVLANLSLEYDRTDWAEHYEGEGEREPAGIMTVGSLVYDVLDKIEDLREQKKSR